MCCLKSWTCSAAVLRDEERKNANESSSLATGSHYGNILRSCIFLSCPEVLKFVINQREHGAQLAASTSTTAALGDLPISRAVRAFDELAIHRDSEADGQQSGDISGH